jgi:4-aminobutyrate aminotransferase-like enzyme/Ser/Thr protein kinase RdoA (MazF antagonist)
MNALPVKDDAADHSFIDTLDAVMTVTPPRFSLDEAVEIASRCFAVEANSARSLGSERDQAFMLMDHRAQSIAVMKVSNRAESIDVLDMEAAAVLHASRVDPTLALLIPWIAPYATDDRPSSRRVAHHDSWVRMYDVADGMTRSESLSFSDEAIAAWGQTAAQLGRALRSFTHPAAVRVIPWDVQHTLASQPMTHFIADPAMRSTVAAVFDRFASSVAPRWGQLRAQLIHGDLHTGNALVDDDGFITGIVDFGDMTHSALVADLASALGTFQFGRTPDESFRVGRLLIDGYQLVTPLEPLELELLTDLMCARTAVGIAITSWREATGHDTATDGTHQWRVEAARWLDHVIGLGWDHASAQLSGALPRRTTNEWATRRNTLVGAALEPLSYDTPVHVASASGVWITTVSGERLLDAYNNVPCVGHSHPRVATAIGRQARVINTNMRYLHESTVELAERLVALSPPGLDSVLFVNSGSEANDLAWRLATNITGRTGALCTSFAYHGISDAIAPMSPEVIPSGRLPTHIETWHPTDTYRGLHGTGAQFDAALERLQDNDHHLAVAIVDGVLQSDGIYDLEPSLVQGWVDRTHAAGGLWIADEVQGGHGRTGDAMWSFERFGITPDFITLGKPMGNGFPVAAVITRREIAEAFRRDSIFFSTFGGNQVASMAALAVLDVLRDELVLERVQRTGLALRAAITEASRNDDRIGDVRGMGLANAIEIVVSRSNSQPDAGAASALKNALRNHGVLVGTTGPKQNILKVRPPLAFTTDHVTPFVDAWTKSLRDTSR